MSLSFWFLKFSLQLVCNLTKHWCMVVSLGFAHQVCICHPHITTYWSQWCSIIIVNGSFLVTFLVTFLILNRKSIIYIATCVTLLWLTSKLLPNLIKSATCDVMAVVSVLFLLRQWALCSFSSIKDIFNIMHLIPCSTVKPYLEFFVFSVFVFQWIHIN